jgi:hypothetical protein
MTTDRFNHETYFIRKQVLKLFGGAFRIYDRQGELVLFASMKAFKLREDIRLYTAEDMRTEALAIKARQIVDFSAAYDVVDPTAGQRIGALKRKGLKSILKDEWIIMDPEDREIGVIREDSMLLALLRRFAMNLIPQKFHATMGPTETPVCTFKQNFNPFVLKLAVDFSQDRSRVLDRRLGLAAGVLLCAIEGRQS